MARGEDTAGHPGRQVHRDAFNAREWMTRGLQPGDAGYALKGMTVGGMLESKRRGGDFGKGPPLQKNESGRGYHVSGAPGYERGDRAVDFYNKVTKDRR